MERRPPGRPAHQPTDATRGQVEGLVREGKTLKEIAQAIGLSIPTLRAHYASELKAERPQISFPFAGSEDAKRKGSSRAGRPEHVPTDETRERVEILIAGGMQQWQIAAALGISEPVLRDRYATELDAGRSKKTAQVIEAQFKAAVEGGNVAAQKAWLSRPSVLEEPPPPPKDEPLGKKQQAALAALTAHQGTEWDNLLPN
jgi:DNA-binding CsgD family transcriptional regulator